MLDSLIVAVAVLIIVGLVCLLLGKILSAVGIPFVTAIGEFLTQWAWVIGLAAGLLSFATGANFFHIGKG